MAHQPSSNTHNDPLRREHYVPQFYLRYFVDTEGLLHCYDKVDDKVHRLSTTDVAVAKGYFRVTLPDGAKRTLEGTLTDLENVWKPAIDAVIATPHATDPIIRPPQQMTLVEKSPILVNFVAVQLLRPRAIRELIDADPAAHHQDTGDLLTDSLTFFHAVVLARGAQDLPARLVGLTWRFVYNYTETPLWTSDNPVVMYARSITRPTVAPIEEMLQSPGIRVHVPLTPGLALAIFDPDVPLPLPASGMVDSRWVWASNRMVTRAALRHIIASDATVDTARRILAHQRVKEP